MFATRRLIAVVDDDEGVCRALKRLIGASNMDVATFTSGQTFLDSLSNKRPDCVVLDLHMPGLTGEEVLKALADADRDLPVIVITGRDDPGNRAMVLALGACAYLPKPLVPAELRAAIDEAVANATHKHGPDPTASMNGDI